MIIIKNKNDNVKLNELFSQQIINLFRKIFKRRTILLLDKVLIKVKKVKTL